MSFSTYVTKRVFITPNNYKYKVFMAQNFARKSNVGIGQRMLHFTYKHNLPETLHVKEVIII